MLRHALLTLQKTFLLLPVLKILEKPLLTLLSERPLVRAFVRAPAGVLTKAFTALAAAEACFNALEEQPAEDLTFDGLELLEKCWVHS
jgi:hypothetical protein